MLGHAVKALLSATALVGGLFVGLPNPVAQAAAQIDPSSLGITASAAAGSCWEIKQVRPSAADGAYWLLTPRMIEPQRFYCDMTTSGGGWVLVGKGREGWTNEYQGKGVESDLETPGLTPMSSVTTQLPAAKIDELLNGGRVDALADGIRLRRATNAAGTMWQEARFQLATRDRWAWTFGAEHALGAFSFDSSTGSGGTTVTFGLDNGYRRVVNSTAAAQQYRLGFAFGSQVTGSPTATDYLWSATSGGGGALPYTEVYLRPKVTSGDPGFAAIGDAGVGAHRRDAVVKNNALNSPWGVTGLAGSTSGEGSVEVQAFTESGSRMYVGGNFAYVQQDASGTGRVSQPFLAAFDVATGQWDSAFRPVLNEQVRALATLPSGAVVAGGDFTRANGQAATAVVALDPVTGTTIPSWNLVAENRGSSNPLRVRALEVSSGYLYIGGTLTHLTGGTRPKTSAFTKNLGRVSATDFTPSFDWNPKLNGGVVALDGAADGTRIYAAGHFTKSNGVAAQSAAALLTSPGAALATPAWTPTWSSTLNYQQGIDEVGDRVWVGGSQHDLFTFSTSSFARLSGNIFKKNGDIQAITDDRGVVYAGCHCNNFNYSNAFTFPTLGAGWTQADALGWFGAWDASTGAVIPSFTPSLRMRLGSGIWALQADANGTVWAGGDIQAVRTGTRAAQWAGGFARFALADATPPAVPTNLRATAFTATDVTLAWGSSGGAGTHYVVLRDDRPIASTTLTTLTVPRAGNDRFFVRAVDAAGNASASTAVRTLP